MYRSIFMCVFLALSGYAYRISEPVQEVPLDAGIQQCVNESGVGPEIFNPRNRIIADSDLLDSKTGCFLSCIWRNRGELKEDGTLNWAKLAAELPSHLADPDGIRQAFSECSKQKGANDCETASKTMLCLQHSESFRNMRPKGVKI